MSPRAGPTIAEPVSCAIIRRRNGAPSGSVVSTQTGVWNVWSSAVDGEAAPGGERHLRGGDRPERRIVDTGASRKKM